MRAGGSERSRVLRALCAWAVLGGMLLACGDQPREDEPRPGLSPWVPPALRGDLSAATRPGAASPAPAPAPAPPSAARAAAASAQLDDDVVAAWARRAGALPERVALERLELPGLPSAAVERVAVQSVRVVLRFDGVAVYRRSEQPEGGGLPRRLVLDLDRARIAEAVPAVLAVGAAGLDRVRAFVLDGEGDRVRVSFDLRPDTEHRLFFLTDPYRVVADFRRPIASRLGPGGAHAERRPVVVIDPGHGGEQPGAKGPTGLKESHVALALARFTRRALARLRPDVRVLMTRDADQLVSLEERVAVANAVRADLFVSIHLNASDAPDEKGGVATFVLDTTDDQAALRLAARENDTDAEGVSRLQLILASLYRKDQVEHSLELAEHIHASTLQGGRRVLPELHDRGVKRALFYVLVGAEMPAVLLEASFISRKPEADALGTDAYRQALADGIAAGIARYLRP